MEESISMWSIILPVVITAITAYCIYQQQKHHLKIQLFIQTVNEFRKLIKSSSIRDRRECIDSIFIFLQKYHIALINQFFDVKFAAIGLSCFEELNLKQYEGINLCELERQAVKGYEDKINAYNYIGVLKEALMDSIDAQKSYILEEYIEKKHDDLKINEIIHSDDDLGNLSDRTYYIESAIILYLMELEIMAVAETVSFMQPIKESLTTIRNKTINFKNKFLDWQIQSKK